jgi:serine/threonine protein kinase
MRCPRCQKENLEGTEVCTSCELRFDATEPRFFKAETEILPTPGFRNEAPSLAPGSLFHGRYEIVRELGRGGMGVVYLVRDNALDGEECALKVILPELTANPEVERLFKREVLSTRKLTHKGIIKTFDYGKNNGLSYFTMEYISGRSLRELLDENKKAGEPADLFGTILVILPILDALREAHSHGMIHRDISPENIIVRCTPSEVIVKLLDFGLARIMNTSQFTRTAHALGKAVYISPEQYLINPNVSERSDLFSVGVILYEMLTNDYPLGRFYLPSELLDLPSEIDATVEIALQNDPEERIESAINMSSQLKNFLDIYYCAECGEPVESGFWKTGYGFRCTGYPSCWNTTSFERHDMKGGFALELRMGCLPRIIE